MISDDTTAALCLAMQIMASYGMEEDTIEMIVTVISDAVTKEVINKMKERVCSTKMNTTEGSSIQ